MSASKEFNKARALFMSRASAPELPASALKLAYLIAFKYMNSTAEMTRPVYQQQMADHLDVTIRQVQRLLAVLEPLGLVIEAGIGRGKANTFRLDDDERATYRSSFSGAKRRHQTPLKGDIRRNKRRHTGRPLPIEESPSKRSKCVHTQDPADASLGKKKSLAREGITPKSETTSEAERASQFERFWRVYPRHKGRDRARQAFDRVVLKRGVPADVLIEAAKRYAAERATAIAGGDPPKYTLHPTTWLNGGNWTDEPEASSASGPPTIDNATGQVIEPAPRRNSHRRHDGDRYYTPEEFAALVLADMEGGR